MNQEKVVRLMEGSKSKAEWNANCSEVEAFYGAFPDYWYSAILDSGLQKRVFKTIEDSTDIQKMYQISGTASPSPHPVHWMVGVGQDREAVKKRLEELLEVCEKYGGVLRGESVSEVSGDIIEARTFLLNDGWDEVQVFVKNVKNDPQGDGNLSMDHEIYLTYAIHEVDYIS